MVNIQRLLEEKVSDILYDHGFKLVRLASGEYITIFQRVAWYGDERARTFKSLIALVDHYKPLLGDHRLLEMYN